MKFQRSNGQNESKVKEMACKILPENALKEHRSKAPLWRFFVIGTLTFVIDLKFGF
jgi:hypothetical protein